MTKNQAITMRIAALVVNGQTPVDALKTVLGAAVVDQMIEDLYNKLRAKEVA